MVRACVYAMENQQPLFQILFRTVRIGSLKTFPPKDAEDARLQFSKDELRFKVVADQKDSKQDAMDIVIPSSGITCIEGHLMRGCPVIWVTTDAANAKNVRRIAGMQMTPRPSPYFDPKSKELADQRLSIIPADDPINQQQQAKFRTIVRLIAAERKIPVEQFFVELTRIDCNEQLVMCTRYISQLAKFQSSHTMKQELVKGTRSAVLEVKKEATSTTLAKATPIVISSDDEEEVKSEPKSSNDSDTVEAEQLKRGASPDQSDFSNGSPPNIVENKKQRIHDWITKDVQSQRRHDMDEIRQASTVSSELGRTLNDSSTSGSPKTRKVEEIPGPMEVDSATLETGKLEKTPGDVMETDIPSKQTLEENNLPSSKIDVQCIRGTASLSADMQTFHQDMESMLSVTPLCICVVRSPYVINLSVATNVKCMAIDNIDGRLTGCINQITDPIMMRPSKNVPAHGLCESHRSRMLKHECCPGCGTFCAGGTFLVCNSTSQHQHRFHRNCIVLTRHNNDCPHCGSAMSCVHEVTVDPSSEVSMKWAQGKDKKKEDAEQKPKPLHPCVARIPGITKPLPERLSSDDADVKFVPDRESLETMLRNLELDIPKKLRFQAKSLIQLVRQGDLLKVMQLLCSPGGNPNARIPNVSTTALHEAVARGNLPMVHLLVTAGADVNLEDEDGKTPIFYAEEMKRADLMKYLITCKADLKHKDCEGMVPLHHAAKQGRVENTLMLLKYGKESLNVTDEGGWTPLVWAAEHRQADTAECLLHYEADVHTVDEEGNVCLQWAALAGNNNILLMCLRRNCYIDHQNMHGDTALHIAAREDNYDCVVTLLAWGADPDMKNKEGRKPADCAPEFSLCWMSLMMSSFIRNSIAEHKGFVPFDRERTLSADISRGREKLPISCVNAVDEAPCPANPPHEFLYVTKNIHKQTSVNCVISKLKSCSCLHECTSSCECGQLNGRSWYDGGGRLLPSFNYLDPPVIYECNMICSCHRSCRNRVIQKGGVRFRLQVFRTRNVGWGVRCLESIKRGSFVCEFIGEVIADAESKEDDSYLFNLDNKPGGLYTIDARFYGNVARFINHHCDPNLAPVRFFVDHHDTDFPRIGLFATRDIEVGEQLGFDYADGFWDAKQHLFQCECGAKRCKYSAMAYRRRKREQEATKREQEKTNMEE